MSNKTLNIKELTETGLSETAYVRDESTVKKAQSEKDALYQAWIKSGRVSTLTIDIMCGIGLFIFGWLLAAAWASTGRKGSLLIWFGLLAGILFLDGTPLWLVVPAAYVSLWIYLHLQVAGYQKRFRKETEEAIRQADARLLLNRLDSEALVVKAKALYELGNKQQAIILYGEALNINPKSPEHQNEFGLIMFKEKKYYEALKAFDAAIAYTPENSPVMILYLRNKIMTLKKLGRSYEAKELKKKLSEIEKTITKRNEITLMER